MSPRLDGAAAVVQGPAIESAGALAHVGMSVPSFGVALDALESSSHLDILATPYVIATDNIPAESDIGRNVALQENAPSLLPIQAAAGAGANTLPLPFGPVSTSVPRRDVGLKVRVTPHINESNEVRLEIEQESSFAGEPTGALGNVPVVQRRAKTTVTVGDQQTVVIGGLMRDDGAERARAEARAC